MSGFFPRPLATLCASPGTMPGKAAASKAARYALLLALGGYMLFGLLTQLILLRVKPLPHYLLEDFTYYLRALQLATHRGNPYQDHSVGTGFLYPPPALLLVGLLALLPGTTLRAMAFISVNLLLLGIMTSGIARDAHLPFQRCWWWYLLAFTFAPLLEMLYVGQINLITAFGIFLLFIYEERRPVVAGLGLSLAICLKVTPIIFLVYLFTQRRWIAICWTLAMLVVEAVTAGLCFGWQPLVTYIAVFLTLLGAVVRGDGNAQALGSLLNYHGWIPVAEIAPVQHMLGFYLLIVFTLCATIAYRRRKPEPLFMVLSLGIMIAPNVMWYHHYVFILLPLFIWLAWSRLHPAVVVWCFLGLTIIQVDRQFITRGLLAQLFVQLTIIQVDRQFITRGLLAQLFVHVSILGILAWQVSNALKSTRGAGSSETCLQFRRLSTWSPERSA
jgi:hypothetical protein